MKTTKLAMMFIRCHAVSSIGIFRCTKKTKIVELSTITYNGLPLAVCMWRYTLKSRSIINPFTGISSILLRISKSKIGDSIVVTNPVYMVYKKWGPFTIEIKPSNPMKFILLPKNMCRSISIGIMGANFCSSSPSWFSVNYSSKHATIRTIMKNRFKNILSKHIKTSAWVSADVCAKRLLYPSFHPLRLGARTV